MLACLDLERSDIHTIMKVHYARTPLRQGAEATVWLVITFPFLTLFFLRLDLSFRKYAGSPPTVT